MDFLAKKKKYKDGFHTGIQDFPDSGWIEEFGQ